MSVPYTSVRGDFANDQSLGEYGSIDRNGTTTDTQSCRIAIVSRTPLLPYSTDPSSSEQV
jgi:hypothetical protein